MGWTAIIRVQGDVGTCFDDLSLRKESSNDEGSRRAGPKKGLGRTEGDNLAGPNAQLTGVGCKSQILWSFRKLAAFLMKTCYYFIRDFNWPAQVFGPLNCEIRYG